MTSLRRRVGWLPAAFALAGLVACVSLTYPIPARSIVPRSGETLVFGRLRFVHDGREYFPWQADLGSILMHTDVERHLWLLRLGPRAVSAELHPDSDGTLAVWLAPGDYALIGSEELEGGRDVLALLRVPAGPIAAYLGELTMSTATPREGGQFHAGALGTKAVIVQPLDLARATLEQRLGALPEAPVESPWCTGEDLPAFEDPELAARARQRLDRGCGRSR